MTTGPNLSSLVRVHSAGREAWAHVLKTWLLSYAQSDFAATVSNGVFHHHHGALAERLLGSGGLRVLSPLDCDAQYCGWALIHGSTLHYVFVKPEYRRMGFARLLLSGLPERFRYTHITRQGRRLVKPPAVYNPYLALGAA